MKLPTRVVCLVAIYFLAGMLGKHAAFLKGDVALVWPHAGLALAAILLFGYRFLPGIVVGAFLFSLLDGKPIGFFTVGTAVGNCVGAMTCAYMLRQSAGFNNRMERTRDAVVFIVLGCLFGTTINALFNVASLCVSGQAAWSDPGQSLVLWWVPNAIGCLVVTPLLLSWSHFRPSGLTAKRGAEATACALGLIAATALAFESWYVHGIDRYPLAYLPYPFLIWAALRFGIRGASLGTLIVSAAAIHAVLHNRGPFILDSEQGTLILVGSYIAITSVANLLLAAASAELAASERRYRAVVQDQTESICRFDCHGTLTFVNDAYCRWRGKSAAELMGSSFLPQISVLDLEIPLQTFLQLTPSDPILTYDARTTSAAGTIQWEQCIVRALFDEHGHLAEFQMVSQDITRRKNVEEALRAEEEKIKAILAEGIMTVDDTGAIVSSNPAAQEMFGLGTEQMAARSFTELIYPDDRQAFRDSLACMADKPVVQLDLRGTRRGSGEFSMHVCVSGLPVNGRAGYVLVIRDVTHPKQIEEQLRHAQRMETVGQLAGGVAHDFNNLLTVVMGNAAVIADSIGASEEIADGARQIVGAAERGMRLTRQLLTFSRKQIMRTRMLDLNESVRQISQMLQRVLPGNVEMQVDTHSAELIISADESMLDQVLMNLAVNARDAMPRGGILLLSTGRRRLGADALQSHPEAMPGDFAIISVSDNGVGIPPEILPRIFEPFFTTKDVGKGTGLGLPTVHGIVKQHKGFIEVQSEVGKGTAFKVYFPLVPMPAEEVSKPVILSPARQGVSELAVEASTALM